MAQTPHKKLGYLISELRKKKGLSKKAFAEALGTSVSSVNRIEAGEVNLTTAQIARISEILNHTLLAINESVDFEITGPTKLHGSITVNPSKNGAMHLLAASLLNRGTTILENIPRIQEIFRMIEVYESIGVSVEWTRRNTLKITPPKQFRLAQMDEKAARKMRSILMIIGAMTHHKKHFKIPHAGGCNMGNRSIAAHKHALKALGIEIKTQADFYEVTTKKLKPAEIIMYEASDTATTNALVAAAAIPGKTVIKYAPPNYEVQDVCFFLEKLGVKIEGIGTTALTVYGLPELPNQEITHQNSEDPIEAMLFIAAAATTGSKLTIKRAPIEFLEMELLKLSYMHLSFKTSKPYVADNGKTKLVDITVYPSKLIASPSKIHPLPYPGLNIDNLPFFVPIATQALGTTLIHDWPWENRAIYFTELNRLGANISLADPHRVFITGPTKLKAAQVVCPPALRPAVIILIAMLAAEGTSILRNVYPIERGYENLPERLAAIGANIRILQDI